MRRQIDAARKLAQDSRQGMGGILGGSAMQKIGLREQALCAGKTMHTTAGVENIGGTVR